MNSWIKLVGICLSIPLLAASKSNGQGPVGDYAGTPHEGPWLLSTRLGGEFSDNRDGVKAKKTSNLDLFVEPRADYRLRDGERTVLDLAVLPMLKWHSNPRENSTGSPQNDTELFGTAAMELMHQLTPRVQLNFSDALTYNDDPEISNGGGSVRRSDNHIWNNAQGGVAVGLTETVSSGVEGGYSVKRYSDSIVAKEEDEDILNCKVYVKSKLGSGYNLFGYVGGYDFKNKSEIHNRGSKVIDGGAGIEKIFNPDVTGKITAGYQHAEYADSSLSNIDTPNGSVELTLRAASETRFRIGGSYGLYAPYVRPYSIQTQTAVSGAIDHDVLPNRLTVSLNGQCSRGRYESEGASYPGGNDDMFSVGLNAAYRVDRTWSLNAGYSYENWDSDVRESFDRNLVNFSVKAEM